VLGCECVGEFVLEFGVGPRWLASQVRLTSSAAPFRNWLACAQLERGIDFARRVVTSHAHPELATHGPTGAQRTREQRVEFQESVNLVVHVDINRDQVAGSGSEQRANIAGATHSIGKYTLKDAALALLDVIFSQPLKLGAFEPLRSGSSTAGYPSRRESRSKTAALLCAVSPPTVLTVFILFLRPAVEQPGPAFLLVYLTSTLLDLALLALRGGRRRDGSVGVGDTGAGAGSGGSTKPNHFKNCVLS
jgi:hypothetical protein